MAVLIPIKVPLIFKRGPPLLPGLIAASVCIASKFPIELFLIPQTRPLVILGDPRRLSAYPIANTCSPICNCLDDPNFTGIKFGLLIFNSFSFYFC